MTNILIWLILSVTNNLVNSHENIHPFILHPHVHQFDRRIIRKDPYGRASDAPVIRFGLLLVLDIVVCRGAFENEK